MSSELLAPRRRKRALPALPPPDSIKQQDGFVFAKPETKKKTVHKKVKLPEYPAALADASVGSLELSQVADEAFAQTVEAVAKAQIHASRQVFTGHFDFVTDAIERISQKWYTELRNPECPIRSKMRAKIESEKEKLKHNINNSFLQIRKEKLEAAVFR
jgi:hypothetical protein